jgi:hypothetical protein
MSSEFIQVNMKRPNGPFLIYDCPDFLAKKNIQMRAFYMILEIDERYIAMDEGANWYTGRVASPQQVEFRVPAWPFPLFPHLKNDKQEAFWKAFTKAVPASVRKEMTNVHSIFDADNEQLNSAAISEARKWTTFLLDFSKVRGVGELSSSALFADAGPTEKLGFDYISIPLYDDDGKEIGTQAFLGFKVGVHPPDGEGSRKVSRAGAAKSALALKREAAKSGGTTVGMDEDSE